MKINRNNYEEYFLLYVDNELSAEQRKAVEDFAEENTDLKAELELLNSLKLVPDQHITIGNKSDLRHDESIVPPSIMENMLLHLDGELPPHEVSVLEAAIAGNKEMQMEWALLQQTKLSGTDRIIYPGKDSLHKKEEKIIGIFQMHWVRYAAAAAILVMTGLFWLNSQYSGAENNEKGAVVLAEQDARIARGKSDAGSVLALPETDRVIAPESGDGDPAFTAENAQAADAGNHSKGTVARIVTASQDRIENVSNTPLATAEKSLTGKEIAIAQTLPTELPKTPIVDITDQPVGETNADIKADYATRALLDGEGQDQPVFMPDGDPTRKGPLRGIVRKANRIFNKVTNPDIDRPMVKVASFEIGLAN